MKKNNFIALMLTFLSIAGNYSIMAEKILTFNSVGVTINPSSKSYAEEISFSRFEINKLLRFIESLDCKSAAKKIYDDPFIVNSYVHAFSNTTLIEYITRSNSCKADIIAVLNRSQSEKRIRISSFADEEKKVICDELNNQDFFTFVIGIVDGVSYSFTKLESKDHSLSLACENINIVSTLSGTKYSDIDTGNGLSSGAYNK